MCRMGSCISVVNYEGNEKKVVFNVFFFSNAPRVLMNFRGFPPGCGDSVADF